MADWVWLRARLTYANVMSTIAAALGVGTGGAYAVDKLGKDSVGSQQIKAGAVRSAEVKDRSLAGRDLAPGAIVGSRLRTGAADSRSIRDGGVGTQDVATGAIDSRSIRDGGIGEADLAFRVLKPGALAGDGTTLTDVVALTPDFATVAVTKVTATDGGLLSLGSINLANPGPPGPEPSVPPPANVSYRVLVDGVPQGATFTQTVGAFESIAAPVALVAPGIAPGTHTIELQARVDSGSAVLGARNLGLLAGVRGPSIG